MAGTSGSVTVRLWASARAAAGVDCLEIAVAGPVTVAALAASVVDQAPGATSDAARLARVLSVCSVLVGEQPVGAADPATVEVAPGATVEFLPPFAGG